jgi:DNA mismatch repair protein MutS
VKKLEAQFGELHATFALDDWVYAYDFAHERLINQFKTANLKGFGLENLTEAIVAAGAILHYLEATEHKDTQHIASISRIDEEKYVWLDRFTIRNLELAAPNSDGGVPLIDILDQTVTAMGSRQLRKWMVLPLKEKEAIEERLDIVNTFYQDADLTEAILDNFRHMADLERLISKVAAGRINPRELLQLKKSLQRVAPVKKLVAAQNLASLRKMGDQLNLCEFLVDKIEKELSEEAPMLMHQGGIIKEGVKCRAG